MVARIMDSGDGIDTTMRIAAELVKENLIYPCGVGCEEQESEGPNGVVVYHFVEESFATDENAWTKIEERIAGLRMGFALLDGLDDLAQATHTD